MGLWSTVGPHVATRRHLDMSFTRYLDETVDGWLAARDAKTLKQVCYLTEFFAPMFQIEQEASLFVKRLEEV
jgi:hypothetical protein